MPRAKPYHPLLIAGHHLRPVSGALIFLVLFCAAYYFVLGADKDLTARFLTTGLLSLAYLVCRPEFIRSIKLHYKEQFDLSAVWIVALGAVLTLATPGLLRTIGGQSVLFSTLTPLFGLGLTLIGVVKLFFQPQINRVLLSRYGAEFLSVFAIGYFGFDLIRLIQPLGKTEIFAEVLHAFFDLTFFAVEKLVHVLGADVYTNSDTREITVENFTVFVWGKCSGIEGFVLISTFLSLYMWMFKERLSFPRAFLLFPIGIMLSWMLNIVRITLLLLLGAHVSESLAVDTFHSQAGWVMFTILAVGLAGGDFAFGWFAKPAWKTSAQGSAPQMIRQTIIERPGSGHSAEPATLVNTKDDADQIDPVAQIVPFLLFVASGLIASTLLETPALVYPLRFLVMLGAVYAFRGYILSIDWRIDPVSAAIGIVIGCAWCATSSADPDQSDALSTALTDLGTAATLIWITTRMLGTIALVPIIEEIFFRGYILSLIKHDTFVWKTAGVCISAIFFAALHDRWLAALIAGLAYGFLCIRKDGRLSDAIVAHAVTNGVIAFWALATGHWAII